jgi:hypothetical protein
MRRPTRVLTCDKELEQGDVKRGVGALTPMVIGFRRSGLPADSSLGKNVAKISRAPATTTISPAGLGLATTKDRQTLNNATLPFALALADKGWRQAMAADGYLRAGLNPSQSGLRLPLPNR